MLWEKLHGEELLIMQKEKGEICVSIIVPTHRLSPERRNDALEIKKTIQKAKELLQFKYPAQQINPLLQSVDELYNSIDFTHNAEGLGFYISKNIKYLVKFDFPVEEKIMIGDNFELRDLLYKANYAELYFLLLLSEKEIKLYEGRWNELHEIKGKNFPILYEEEFIYERSSSGTSYAGYTHVKSFEKDKSVLEEKRFKDLFREADKWLKDYLVSETPLILTGPEKELAWFENITAHKKNIIKKVHGSYSHANLKQLSDIAWPAMHFYLESKRMKLIDDFKEKIGMGLGISGIQDIWSAVKEGKAFKLLVEKDYRCPGFVDRDQFQYQLYLRPPQKPHKMLADAVDDLIEMVIQKNGQVCFVNNGLLIDYKRIALITRYG